MDPVLSPPVHRPESAELRGTESGISWLARLSARGYRLLLLCLCTSAALLASEGMQRLAALRANYYLAVDRGGAVSPIAHGARLPALGALAATAPAGVRAVVRADSAGEGAAALCALAAELKNAPGVVWIAGGGGVDACVRASIGRIVPATAAARTELARARWVLLDGGGLALHSGRTVPAARDVRALAALLAPTAAAVRP
ncbi:MAG TPA: hypothetical protein VGC13_29185 [Longimicrobium sp.]|jgi:hypothetical protein